MGALVLVLAAIVLLPLGIILDGWAISVLWNWFVVTYIHAPVMSVTVAIGFKLTWCMFSRDYDDKPAQARKREWWEPWAYMFVVPLLVVGMGWFVRFLV